MRKRVKIEPMALLFIGWMVIFDRGGLGVVTMLAAILHECGHILAAKLLKIPLKELRLDLLGARLEVSGRMLSYGEEWLLSMAGPFVSLLCAAVASLLWKSVQLSVVFSCVSFLLGMLNLLPIRTFDGGRMLECTLLGFFSLSIARKIIRFTSFWFLFFLWCTAVYFLLRANDGLSLLCFSMSLFSRFFNGESLSTSCA